MKLLLYYLLIVIITVNISFSAYLSKVPQTVNQPDGTILNCYATGDEYFNRLHDANNYTIIQNEQGWYVYADLLNDNFVATSYIPGKDNPAANGLKSGLIYSPEKLLSFRNKFSTPSKPNITQKNKDGLLSSKNKGVLNNIAIFIRFADESGFTQSTTYFDTPYNAKGQTSVYDYFWTISYNQIQIHTSFYPIPNNNIILSYQDTYPRSYYKKYNATSAPDGYKNDAERTDREMLLIKNALNYVKNQIPANLDVDLDKNGLVDNVAFIVTGSPEGWADLIWPHMWALFQYNETINGARVWDFNFLMANWFDPSVLSHEMFHTLGAPDLYRYSVAGEPVGYWDVMASNLNPPQHPSMYVKYKYGNWIDGIPVIDRSGWYELNPSSNKYGSVIRVNSRNNPDEFYILEYRKDDGKYDKSLPSDGLLVWRINTKVDGNSDGPPDGIYVYRYDGTPSSWGNISQAPFAAEYGRTKMNNYSTNPKPFLSDGSLGGLNLSNVGTLDKTIKFRLNFPPYAPTLVTPANNIAAVGNAPYFEWQKGINADNYTFELSSDISFTTNVYYETGIKNNYITLPIQLDFNKKYYWRVTSNSEYEEPSASSAIWVINTTPIKPVISHISATELLCKDQEMLILVETEGQVMQYQWFKDGILIPGADKPLLTNKNVDFLNSGDFQCRVTNYPGWDTVYSDKIPVYVVTSSDFLRQPTTTSAKLGGKVNFSFKVHINGLPSDNYVDVKWFKNDIQLVDGSRVEGSTTDLLSLVNLQEDDFGANYRVEVTGICGTTIVSDNFTIEKLPDSQTIEIASEVCQNAVATISIDKSYFGNADNTNIEISTVPDNIAYETKGEGQAKVIEINSGVFPDKLILIYSNKEDGSELGKIIYTFNVQHFPVLSKNLPQNLSIEEDEPLLLEVASDNYDNIEWYKNDEHYPSLSGATKLLVSNANDTYNGVWQAKLSNRCGATNSTRCNVTVLKSGTISGISDYTDEIKIFPNPANDIMEISSNEGFDKITIIDILGNIVAVIDTELLNNYRLDVNQFGLVSGTYFIKLQRQSTTKTLRFSIVR
ncbi:MAG TPA: M6 family metalloprotease domain-containing protein [Candidatus Kapabacteria bacterium]|nr:M6 family metalloprotease domain-containing protein [Candidatus Kapabacteria bacterium]